MAPEYGHADRSQPTGGGQPPGGFAAGTAELLAQRNGEVEIQAGVDGLLVDRRRRHEHRLALIDHPRLMMPMALRLVMVAMLALPPLALPALVVRLGAGGDGEN